MNERIKDFWVALVDNRVIAFGSNKMDFYNSFVTATGYTRGYYTFRKFITEETYYAVSISGKDYYFQKVV